MKNLILLMLSLTFFAACAGSNGDGGSAPNTVQRTVTIQGKSPQEYYKQFLYHESTDCGQKDSFKFLSSLSISLFDLENGHEAQAELYVYLEADGSFYAEYEEDEIVQRYSNGSYATKPLLEEVINGRWSIDENGAILLGVLGRGTGLKYNNSETIDLTLGSYFADKRVRYRSVVLVKVSSFSGKRTDELCGRKL